MLAKLKQLSRKRRQAVGAAGFTMIELLMTMLILTIVMLGLAALQVGTIRRVTASRRSNEATRLAQSQLERYRHINCDALPGDSLGAWAPALLPDGSSQMANVAGDGVNPGPFTVQEWVEDIGDNKVITIRTHWGSQERKNDGTVKQYQVAVSLRRICP